MRWIAIALAAVGSGGLAAAPAVDARPTHPADQVVLVLDHGVVERHRDPRDPALELPSRPGGSRAPGGRARAARSTASPPPSFAAQLDRLLASGAIDRPTRDRYRQSLLAARRSLGRLSGTRRVELGAVLTNLERIAAAGMLTPSRLPALVLTLERNRQWWTTGPLLGDGQRVGFAGSGLVWEYYAGQGIEIQWLGTFGKANGYFLGGRGNDGELRALLDEALGLATQRAGGIAWEYDFRFDGGAPPWVSGLAQGTAVQVLARAAVRFTRADYFNAAHAGLGVFEAAPPEGVRVATAAGAHYLIYSFAPRERVLNAFIQALVGLHDYAGLANSDDGRALFAAGEAEARLEVPQYDTGAWSLYDQSTESDLGYHTLLRDFLAHLCQRLRFPGSTVQASAASAGPPPGTAAGPSGGTPPTPPATGPTPPATAPSPDVYCTTADHFTAYVHQPPTIAIAAAGPDRAGRPVRLRLALSKISEVTLTASRAGQTVYRMTEQLGHGTRMVVWHPAQPGRYGLSASATDLAGNSAAAGAAVTVAPAAKHR
ncbi:MAG: hypothetical protein QOF77_1478 [Solirubrobacteraceae bacterium]|nr:hypothetical protein [Solirubrobacteraceae bacterium]